ncbi:hypothetical protein E3N88_04151 [Mikania micrantha]|uniref:Integrase catalytic domain-containing protein n=1 Tax=Mikania micrantha TaxID=192012 RepID=A0A5N6PUJ8_9ASTR|nr:hypothetical protein E3N88_04151 [Mikania micrantha]
MTPSGGHSGFYRTYRRLAANLYWPRMTATIKRFVRECDVCHRCKASSVTPRGLLQPLPISKAIWENLSMDFIVGLPISKGFNVIFVVVDRLSKYAHFILLKHHYTARTVVDVFVREVIHHHGVPKSNVGDRDPLFLSKFWQEIFRSMGTQLSMSSAYHPELDGQTEVINRCTTLLKLCMVVNHLLSSNLFMVKAEESVARVLHGRDEALKQLKVHLSNAQSSMKVQADKKRRDIHFVVGDWEPTDVALPPELMIGDQELSPTAILAKQPVKTGSNSSEQWLIQLQGQSHEDATWEDAVCVQGQFPNTSLEDKTFLEGGSDDTNSPSQHF